MIMLVADLRGGVVRRVDAAGGPRPTSAKQAPYECGIVPEPEPAERFPVHFYLVAMAFIVLDVEIIFLYPFTASSVTSVYGLLSWVSSCSCSWCRSRTSSPPARSIGVRQARSDGPDRCARSSGRARAVGLPAADRVGGPRGEGEAA